MLCDVIVAHSQIKHEIRWCSICITLHGASYKLKLVYQHRDGKMETISGKMEKLWWLEN